MPRTAPRRTGGFTLLELLTTMAVGIVLVGFAVPSMSAFMRSNRVMTAADSFNSAVSKARTIAAATNSYVTVAPIDGNWQNGWQVFNEHAAPNGEYNTDNDNLIVESEKLPSDVTITSTTIPEGLQYISFSPVGYSQSMDKKQMAMSVGFQIGVSKRVVEIGLLGRARVCNPDVEASTCVMP
ncbi:GspH/FimT family pseudopilin [Cupriavidus pauculus]|uniref:GspH/FimT family pseudopilin n=1 Tax=Cupriavidus pauculus TaxID=82633 RepID=UPI001EE17565|nr:GspH/FimT family pseudopilin [Cupriavidus pauculus]GJG96627.1 pilus assembly protein FimT [Cupriavidus pauculus]